MPAVYNSAKNDNIKRHSKKIFNISCDYEWSYGVFNYEKKEIKKCSKVMSKPNDQVCSSVKFTELIVPSVLQYLLVKLSVCRCFSLSIRCSVLPVNGE